MTRNIRRSALAYVTETMKSLSADSDKSLPAVLSVVARDEGEQKAVETILKVMAKQGHIIVGGTPEAPIYRLSDSGVVLIDALEK